jgi:nucleotide-binding universal stress UspA family protein
MNGNSRILAAYDGSIFAERALDDLGRAGLPANNVELLLMEVAEVWLPPSNVETEIEPKNFITEEAQRRIQRNQKILAAAAQSVSAAGQKVAQRFPNWTIKAKATYGSPAWEILFRADDFKPDLIAVGSHGRSMLERIWLGSVSQKIVTEAHCSVRVTRGEVKPANFPLRLILAFDGTKGAEEAVRVLARRQWPAGTEVRVVMVEDDFIVQEAFAFERDIFEKAGTDVVNQLALAGLKAELLILQGNPKHQIVAEAQRFGADCIYVGATKFDNKLERFLLGSVSSAITARAHCSVEVVRPNYYLG